MSESYESPSPGEDRQEYDCAECGLCCIDIGGPLYASPADRDCWRQLGLTGLEEKVENTGADHSCPFLTLEKPFRCTIYFVRPTVCVKFENGGGNCRALRAKHGLPL
jgi:Fe-S-cluster containining protein